MFRRPSKKQLLIRRTIVTVLMIIAVLVTVTATVLFISGYRLDTDKGRLQKGALVQFESLPEGALISIDGKSTGKGTNDKQTIIAGSHSFTMTKNGYLPWTKTLTINAGTLVWLDYIRLIPEKLNSQTIASYDSVYAEKASPNFRTLIIQEKADSPTFQLADIRSQDVRFTTIALPANVYTAPAPGTQQSFTLGSWDGGGRHIIIQHKYGDSTEWIVLDTLDVASSVNVSRLMGISFKDLQFLGTSGNILYGLTSDDVIRRLDLSSGTISRALVTDVKNFEIFETNVMSYVGIDPEDSTKQVAGIYREGDESSHILRRVDSIDTPVRIDVTRYFSDDFVAISEGKDITILKGRYPSSSSEDNTSLQVYAELSAEGDATNLSFSPEGDYLLAQSGLSLVSYEIEYKRVTNNKIETSETAAHELQWLDDAYLWAVYDGHLSMREFDGTNIHVINSAEPGFDVTMSQKGRYIYSITKSDDKYKLQRVTLIL